MSIEPRELLLRILRAAIAAVNGGERVRAQLRAEPPAGPVWLLAVGKAAAAMAQGAHDALGSEIRDGLVITKHGHAEPLPWPVLEAGHPLPDAASLVAGAALLSFAARLPPHATVLVLLSGGASALVEALPEGMALDDLRQLNGWLLASGLDIAAMNRIRKRVSRIKGGRLARLLAPRPVVCLAISDVPGDVAAAIGSGPLTADRTVLDEAALPDWLQRLLASAPPLPPADDPCFDNVRYRIVARNADALRAAAEAARQYGLPVVVEEAVISGEAAVVGQRLATALLAAPAGAVHVWGGEPTVALPPHPGRGGRNQTLALAAALALRGRPGVWLLAAGTDGSDGPTDDAGALVDGESVARGEQAGLSATQSLQAADAGSFLAASGDLIQTGPTGTNVMDLVLGLRSA